MSDSATGSSDPFTASIRDFFASMAGGALADQGVGLNFDILPLAIGNNDVCDDAGHYSAARATEFFSRQIANHSAHASDGIHYTNLAPLSDQLQFQLTGSARFYGRPDRAPALVEADRKKFESYVHQSVTLLERTLASLAPVSSPFPPSEPIPSDWADREAVGNWKSFHRTFKAQAPRVPSDDNAAPDGSIRLPIRTVDTEAIKRFIEDAAWKRFMPPSRFPIPVPRPGVIDPHDEFIKAIDKRWRSLDPHTLQGGITRPAFASGTGFGMNRAVGGAAFGAGATMPLLDAGKPAGPTLLDFAPTPAHDKDSAPDPDSIFKTGVLADAVETTATDAKDEVTVSFEFIFVKIERPWIFWPMLMDSNWYIEGMRRGELTAGAEGNPYGALSLVPERMIVVRNLRIDAHFTDQDRDALGKAFAIGPFRLTTIDLQSEAIREPGMQVIGYIDRAMPPLPPRTDPSIVT